MKNSYNIKFNNWVIGLIWVNIILGGFRGVMNSLANMLFNPVLGCIELGLTVIGIIALFNILQARKWGLYLWISYIFIAAYINDYVDNSQDYYFHIIFSAFKVLVMILFLQIRKDGVSAWTIILNKDRKVGIKEAVEKSNTMGDLCTEYKSPNKRSNEIESTIQESEMSQNCINSNQTFKRENSMDKKSRFNDFVNGLLLSNKWKHYIEWGMPIVIIIYLGVWIFTTSTNQLSKYVYIEHSEESDILHADRNCKDLSSAEYIDTIYLNYNCFHEYCTKCVSDIIAKEIDRLLNRNSQKIKKQNEIENTIKIEDMKVSYYHKEKVNLYNYLSNEYDMGTLEVFLSDIDNSQKRRKLYNSVIKLK